VAYYEPEHKFVELAKFAAMGSVVCFTIESLVFLAMAMTACELSGYKGRVSVYGDDVILPSQAVPVLAQIAEALGFKLNADKSFYSGRFRQSCGAFAFNGADITVPSYPRQYLNFFEPEIIGSPEARGVDFTWATAVNSSGNEFFLADMPFSRYCCIAALIGAGLVFVSGNPETWTPSFSPPIRSWKFEKEWLYLPQAPLFAYSPCEHLRVVRAGEYSDETEKITKRTKYALGHLEYPPEPLLGPPVLRRKYRVRVVATGRGFKNLTYGQPTIKRALSDEERLAIWLYQAEFTERRSLFDVEGFPSIFEPNRAPLAVYTGKATCVAKSAILLP
jgi:hypothetical protein